MADPAEVFAAIRAGDPEALRRLLEAEPSLASARNEADASALLYALYHRRQDLADLILAKDPEMNIFDAAAAGDAVFVTELLDRFPAFLKARAADGFTLLHLAAFFGREEVLDLLLARGAESDAVAANEMKVRPIHSAASAGRADLVETLLAAGADPDARQTGGWTALHAAALHGDEAMAKVLLARGADPAAAADDGRTAAAMAESKGHGALAALLRC